MPGQQHLMPIVYRYGNYHIKDRKHTYAKLQIRFRFIIYPHVSTPGHFIGDLVDDLLSIFIFPVQGNAVTAKVNNNNFFIFLYY